jgi:hypothetical protein
VLPSVLVEFAHKLSTHLHHLFHCTISSEFTTLEAVLAVIFVNRPVGFRTENVLREWHSTTLTKLLYHNYQFIDVLLYPQNLAPPKTCCKINTFCLFLQVFGVLCAYMTA